MPLVAPAVIRRRWPVPPDLSSRTWVGGTDRALDRFRRHCSGIVQQAHAGDEGGTVEVAGDQHETGAPVGGRPSRQAQRRREDMLEV
jgi:hypothetical protein